MEMKKIDGLFYLILLFGFMFFSGVCLTQPSAPAWVNDGLGADEDWTTSTTQLSTNWVEVPYVKGYEYAIGTTGGGAEVVLRSHRTRPQVKMV